MSEDREKDQLEQLFHDRLYDYEAEVDASSWEAIQERLSPSQKQPVWRTRYYWIGAAAAAAACLVLLIQSLEQPELPDQPLDLLTKDDTSNTIDQTGLQQPVVSQFQQVPLVAQASVTPKQLSAVPQHRMAEPHKPVLTVLPSQPAPLAVAVPAVGRIEQSVSATPARAVTSQAEEPRKVRRWSVGMGAGAVSLGSDNMVPLYVMNTTSLRSESLMTMNAAFLDKELPKTDIHHKTPVSFGLSVSYGLNPHWALQTGLNYTYLSSSWTTNGVYQGKTKQKLHFLGVPLAAVYQIAEWKQVRFYASAGAMAEINVAGQQSTRLLNAGQEMTRFNEHVRMKKLLWSANGHVGAAYPLLRFVSAFAEVGASYYWDNGSPIETIHREKPFNVDLQVGLRLGF